MSGGQGGRPRAIDDEKRGLILGFLRAGGSMTGAAGTAGVAKSTLYAEMKNDPGFRTEVDKARAESEGGLVAAIRGQADTDWRSAAWLLERLHGHEYGNLQKHEVSGPDGGPLIVFRPAGGAEWGKDASGSDGE